MSVNVNRVASSHENQIKYYILKSRNVLKMSNFGQALNSIISGPDEICNLWTNIGSTEHDFNSFMIDMTFYSVCVLYCNFAFNSFEFFKNMFIIVCIFDIISLKQ